MIKAIVFDFDGLILDTEFVLYEVFCDLLKDHSADLSIAEYASFIGTDSEELYAFIESHVKGKMTKQEIIEESHRIHKEKLMSPIAREGVHDYLQEAKKLGLKIGLASSSNREWVTHFLQELKIIDYFDVIQTSDDVEKVKPDPTLYSNVINKMNITPSEAIAFEDSANGAKAAISAGLKCVIVPNAVSENLVFENYQLRLSNMKEKSLNEVIDFIDSVHVS